MGDALFELTSSSSIPAGAGDTEVGLNMNDAALHGKHVWFQHQCAPAVAVSSQAMELWGLTSCLELAWYDPLAQVTVAWECPQSWFTSRIARFERGSTLERQVAVQGCLNPFPGSV